MGWFASSRNLLQPVHIYLSDDGTNTGMIVGIVVGVIFIIIVVIVIFLCYAKKKNVSC